MISFQPMTTPPMTQLHSLILRFLLLPALAVALPLSLLYKGEKKLRITTPYLSGANVVERHLFTSSVGADKAVANRNYYLDEFFKESRLTKMGMAASIALLMALLMVIKP